MQNQASATQNEPLDTTSLSPLEAWPKHMYIVENGDKSIIRCEASGCNEIFKSKNDMQLLVNHYEHPWPASGHRPIEHAILHVMHTLNMCLVCGAVFLAEQDARPLFHHVIREHPWEDDMSTIQGFLVHVRKFSYRVPIDVRTEKGYQSAIFKLAFEQLKLSLTEGVWANEFKNFLGYGGRTIPDDVLLSVLTVPGEIEFYPIHPDAFLFYVQYDPRTSLLSPTQWQAIRYNLQGLYRTGKI